MKYPMETRADQVKGRRRRKNRWNRAFSILASVVVFCTTYALILPAITIESRTYCGQEEHTHEDSCYTRELVCGYGEGEIYGHVHTDECYTTEAIPVCGLEETDGHAHADECYTVEVRLGCGREEDPGHYHSDDCYQTDTWLACGLEDDPEHEHTDDCYVSESFLACGQEEREGHEHSDSCYVHESVLTCGQEAQEAHRHSEDCCIEKETLTCGLSEGEAHEHTDDCYIELLACEKPEHTHTDICFSNPNADVESASHWERTLPSKLTGVWADDILAVAKSQLGYNESTSNYIIENGSHKGYSRYGAWYGIPYGDWCAMFVSFCLHYADIPADYMPRHSYVPTWVELAKDGLREDVELVEGADHILFYEPGRFPVYVAEDGTEYQGDYEGYLPQPGDIIFFDWERDNDADHVGIVCEVKLDKADQPTEIITIEGNRSNTVRYVSYYPDDSDILGYARLPENPYPEDVSDIDEIEEEIFEDAEENADEAEASDEPSEEIADEAAQEPEAEAPITIMYEGEDYDIRVTYGPEAGLPDYVGLAVREITDDSLEFNEYSARADEAVGEEQQIRNARFFDITLVDGEGAEIALADESTVAVEILFRDTVMENADDSVNVIHFGEDGGELLDTEAAVNDEGALDGVSFTTGGFSVYGVLQTREITQRFITANGETYIVTVTYEPEAQIPEGATLSLTEYAEDSAEYAEIRALQASELDAQRAAYIEENVEAVLADFQERAAIAQEENFELEGETPDETAVRELLGMVFDEQKGASDLALIDITILDAEGVEIEPAAPVDVQIVMETLPEGVTAGDLANTLRVHHIVEQDGELTPELVANAAGAEGAVEISADGEEIFTATAAFTTESFSFYTIGWDAQGGSSNQRFTVYYGYEMTVKENGVDKTYFHEFGNQIQKPPNGHNSQSGSASKYRINTATLSGTDFANYSYKRTYIRKPNGDIYTLSSGPEGNDPVIYGTGNGFKVVKWNGEDIFLSNADEIYVVYESPHGNGLDYNYVDRDNGNNNKRGGTKINPDGDGGTVDLGEPAHTKTLAENVSEQTGLPDNTYELTLTATGNSESKEHHTKADILVIWDISGSMRVPHNDQPAPYIPVTAAAENLANELRAATGGYEDAISYTFIKFNHWARFAFQNGSTDTFLNQIRYMANNSGSEYGYATNWEDGLRKAATVNTREDAKQYVLFITDGRPTLRNTRGSQYAQNNWTNTGNGPYLRNDEWVYVKNSNGVWEWKRGEAGGASGAYYGDTGSGLANAQANVNTTIDLGRAIGQAGMEFYGIGVAIAGEDMTQQMNALADAAGGKAFIAYSAEEIADAFSPIIEAIKKDFEYQFVEINDTLSATTETVLVDTPGDFKYYRYITELPLVKPDGFSVISEATGQRVVVDEVMWQNMRFRGSAPGNFPGKDANYLLNVILNATDEQGNYYIPNHDLYLPVGKTWDDLTLEQKGAYKWEYYTEYQEMPWDRPSYLTDADIASHNWQRWRQEGYDPDNPTVSARTLYNWAWSKLNDADKAKYLPYPKNTMSVAEMSQYAGVKKPVPQAVYDADTGKVTWELSEVPIEKDVTYAVAFTVYPNQDGWDKITDLKNHANDPTFNWDSIGVDYVKNADGSVDLFEQINDENGNYIGRAQKPLLSLDTQGNVKIASNDSAELKYRQINTIKDTQGNVKREPGEEKTATYVTPHMSVDPSEMKLRKIWKDTLVPRWPIDEVDLEIWYVSKGDVEVLDEHGDSTGYWKDSDTGDYTEKTEVAYVDDQRVTWYWGAKYEDVYLSEGNDLGGYINIHESNETLTGTGATIITKNEFQRLKYRPTTELHIDSENYLKNGNSYVTNSEGHIVQYFAFWETTTSIAPGLVATNIKQDGKPLTGAEGHFYAFREMDTSVNQGEQFEQHFELDSTVVRPMKRDGVMDQNGKMLTGINSRKGELAVTKMALTQDRHEINPDVPFQVTVTFTKEDGSRLTQDEVRGTDENDQPIIVQTERTDLEYVVYDAAGNVVDIDSITGSTEGSYTVGVTSAQISGGAGTAGYHKKVPYVSTGENTGYHQLVFSKLYPDWTIVFVNLPSNAKWSVQETYNPNGVSDGYIFEGYTLPDAQRGHETLHPQPHFQAARAHYSGGTARYDNSGSIIETDLIKITNFDDDPFNIKGSDNQTVALPDGSARQAISGYVDADAEELVDIHNTRTADDLEIKKTDADTGDPLAGAKFVIESYRPQTEWRIHDEDGKKEWREVYVFGNNGDDPNMTEIMGPAHYPAKVHLHDNQRYVVRGDVIGVLYAKPRSEWPDAYTPVPLDRDGNVIENVQWVTVPAGTSLSGLTAGVHYINQGGVNYILRPSTDQAGKYEKIVDTGQTHVYYYVESNAQGLLHDTDPNHATKLKELPIIAGDRTLYKMYEIEAPAGYTTVLQQMQETSPGATQDDAAFDILVTSARKWSAEQNRSVPYIEYTDPRSGKKQIVYGEWDTQNSHWDFNFSIGDKKGFYDLELKKIQSGTNVVTMPNYRDLKTRTETTNINYYNVLATSEVTAGNWSNGKTVIWHSGYNTLVTAGRIDAEGYALTADKSQRMKDANGNYVLYMPIACEHKTIGEHTADCFNSGKVETIIDDAATPGMSSVRFSLFQSVDEDTEGAAFWYYNSGVSSPQNYKNVLNPDRDVLTVSEYAKLKSGTLGSAQGKDFTGLTVDADGYLVNSSGARVQHSGKDVMYQPNFFVSGNSEAGKEWLVPAVNQNNVTLLGLTTDADGRIDFGKLAPGTYWLFEQTPAGYTEAKPTKIEVKTNGVTYVNDAQNGGAPTAANGYAKTETVNNQTLTTMSYEMQIVNTPENVRLPNTGGAGTQMYTMVGLLLMAVSGAGYLLYKARRRREVWQRE